VNPLFDDFSGFRYGAFRFGGDRMKPSLLRRPLRQAIKSFWSKPELPGWTRKTSSQLFDDRLTIKGERRRNGRQRQRYYHLERSYGRLAAAFLCRKEWTPKRWREFQNGV
jgi:hypothetical protein